LKTTKIYFAPFHSTSDDSSTSPCGTIIATFKKAVTMQDWPYDVGDDPSFYAMRQLGGQLSWGICRQDVRNSLRPGDIVAFFAFHRFEETGDSEYRFCALASVDKCVSQIDLWRERSLRVYRKYFNLLIRPSKSVKEAWEHFEPTLTGSRVHHDWLWRLAEHQGFQKKHFKELEETDLLGPGASIRRRPVVIAKNYVLFSDDTTKTHVLSKPPVVAWHSRGKPAEDWNQDKFSQVLKRLTLDVAEQANGRKRSLRIRNSQRAHRHIVFELPSSEAGRWRAQFLDHIRGR
jgi:hypothetical protein